MLNTCDDCGKQYPGKPYYTFEKWNESVDQPEGCTTTDADPLTGEVVIVPHDCTENMCADCAGPFIDPDIDGDSRRPVVDFYDERLHANMLWADSVLVSP